MFLVTISPKLMFPIIHSLTQDFTPDFSDDGSSLAPIVQTMYVCSYLQKTSVTLTRLASAVDALLVSMGRSDRYAPLALTDRTQAALLDLSRFSNGLYWISAEFTYAEQARIHGYGQFDALTQEYQLIQRANPLIETRILVCEPNCKPINTLLQQPDEALFEAGGFHTVGRRDGLTGYAFKGDMITEDLLVTVHEACFQARQMCAEKLLPLRDIWDLPIQVSQYMDVSQRMWDHLDKANPLPPGIEPSGRPRVSL